MVTIWEDDLAALKDEGWQNGTYWSEPGRSGTYLRHPELTKGEWVQVILAPASDRSLAQTDEDGAQVWVGPSGECESATEAFMGRIGQEASK